MEDTAYDCFSLAVTVSGLPEAHERIRHYFHPTASATSPSQAHITLDLRSEEELVALVSELTSESPEQVTWGHPDLKYWVVRRSAEDSEIRLVPQTESPHVLAVDPDDGMKIRITAAHVTTLGRTAVRLMRQLMIRHAERQGGVIGHGAAVIFNGSALVLAGLPGAGKTTVGLTLSEIKGTDLVASDRLTFLPGSHGQGWQVAGIPVPWRIADGTIGGVGKLARAFAEEPTLFRGCELVGGKHELVTSELASMLGVQAQFDATVGAIVILGRGKTMAVEELSGAGKVAALAATLFNADDRLFVTDWLGAFGLISEEDVIVRAELLAASARVISATWTDYCDIAPLAELIASAIENGKVPCRAV